MILLEQDITSMLSENLKISVVNMVILLTCVLTLIYLFVSHVIQKKHQRKLNKQITLVTEEVGVGVCVLDFNTLKIKRANKGFYKLTGFTVDEIERVYDGSILKLGKGNNQEKIEEQLKDSSHISTRFEMKRKNDTTFWVYMQGSVDIRKNKRVINVVLMDVDKIIKKEEMDKFNEERYRIASDVAGDILFEYDMKLDQMVFSERYYDMFNTSEVIPNYLEYLRHGQGICKEDNLRLDELINQIKYETVIQGEFRMKDVSGNYVWVQLKGRKVKGKDGKYKKIYGKLININNVKVEISRLKQVSEIDVLTGLLNKGAIKEEASNLIESSNDYKALFIIDVDNFKRVNDTLGHQFGDIVLSTIGRKLKTAFPNIIFGRYGGDEFLAITKEHQLKNIESIANSINKMVAETYENEGKICAVSASIGISISNIQDYEKMLKVADDALYETKKKGKNTYTISKI